MKMTIVDKDGIRHYRRIRAATGYTWVPFINGNVFYWHEVKIRTLPIIPKEYEQKDER